MSINTQFNRLQFFPVKHVSIRRKEGKKGRIYLNRYLTAGLDRGFSADRVNPFASKLAKGRVKSAQTAF
ncbi:hypothetical protein NF673_07545 [Pseudomonas moraviensis]|uniref:hypothetical protein n=1 Tax=Pseudomonas moraviensis TaxID=321662 RepID=UPI002092A0E4|nr:hypothetical protein [Pseudomonas moraviensis]UST65608.1 hypothetical protein NF673_07545 [Pseudomonas moraviensis]